MSRVSLILLLIVVVLVGGTVWLSRRDTEVPLTRIEKPVTIGGAGATAGNGAAQ